MHRLQSWAPALVLGVCLAAGCAEACAPRSPAALTLVSYNVENLFDGRDAGTEYPEYSVAQGRWDEARYKVRLDRLGEVLRAAAPSTKGPDVACLLEVENLQVLEDLRKGSLAGAGYGPPAFVPSPGQAVGCGILSRFPLLDLKAHALKASPRGGRHILEARLKVGEGSLVVFVNHWKSKLEGAEATEGERREAAALLASRVASLLAEDGAGEVLACGDFNESPDETLRIGGAYPTALRLLPPEGPPGVVPAPGPLWVATREAAAGLTSQGPALYSPWAEAEGYSYVNRGVEERIDGFLLAPGLLDGRGLSLASFRPLQEAFLLDPAGRPLGYSPSSGRGYSDHLPLVLVLSREGGRGK